MGCHCRETHCVHRDQEPKPPRFPNAKPSYLPQPSDAYTNAEKVESEMGPIGPWATGRVSLSTKTGLTGVRPIVDRYTITRYNPQAWRKKNQETLDMVVNASQLRHNVQCTIDTVVSGADKFQTDTTKRLEDRVKLVRDCLHEVEALVKEFREEIVLLSETKIKLKFMLPMLKMPESIAGECIERRTTRLEPDLVNDEVEIQLVKELALIHETKELFMTVLIQLERQMKACMACKNELELTWSDKKETCELESVNACLRNSTPIIWHYGGAVRTPNNQSSPESWGIFNVTLITTAKKELEKSRGFRDTIDTQVIADSVQALRNQADVVYKAFLKRIEETDQCRQLFEVELHDVLRQIADAESLYGGLIKLERQLDYNMRVVETRMENRLHRPRGENCRDEAQYGMLDEAKYLNDGRSTLRQQIEDIDKVVSKLYETRANLEAEILIKRKSLYVDQQRCMAYRERYPDAVTLGGGNA